MPKPESVIIIYEDGTEGVELHARADGSYGTWGQHIRDNNTRLASEETAASRKKNTMYKDHNGHLSDKRYSLNCFTCVRLECTAQELHKAPTEGYSPGWDQNFISGHKHSTVTSGHHKDCPCVGRTGGKSNRFRKQKRNVIIKAEVEIDTKRDIETDSYPIKIGIEIPAILQKGTEIEIRDQQYDEIIENIIEKIKNYDDCFEDIKLDQEDNRLITGILKSLPKVGTILLIRNRILKNTDVKAIALSVFDSKKLSLLIWEKTNWGTLRPIILDSGDANDRVKIKLGTNHYLWGEHPICKNDVRIKEILDCGKSTELNNPLETISLIKERTLVEEFCNIAFQNFGYSHIVFIHPIIDIQVQIVDPLKTGGVNALLFASSKVPKKESDDGKRTVNLEFRRPGSTRLAFGIDESVFSEDGISTAVNESRRENELSIDWIKGIESFDIESGVREIIALKIKGRGTLTARFQGNLVLSQNIRGTKNDTLEITQAEIDFETLQNLIPAIMSNSRVTGFDDYIGLP